MLRMRWRNGTVDRGGDRDLVAEHRAHDADGAQKLRAQKCHIYMPSSSILCRMPGKTTLDLCSGYSGSRAGPFSPRVKGVVGERSACSL